MKRYIKAAVRSSDEEDLHTRFEMANDFSASRRFLEQLAETDPDPNVRRDAQGTLHILDDRDRFINEPAFDAELIELFRGNCEPRVRWEVAQHPNTSLEMLQELVEDEDYRVRKAAEKALKERGL